MVDPLAARLTHWSDGSGERKGQLSDVAIARAVAAAVRDVPGVAGLYRGHLALAATYGPLQVVTGVVVHHAASQEGEPDDIGIEVHVILSSSSPASSLEVDIRAAELASAAEVGGRSTASGDSGLLPAIAAQIRRAVQSTVQNIGPPRPVDVDVYIDDIG